MIRLPCGTRVVHFMLRVCGVIACSNRIYALIVMLDVNVDDSVNCSASFSRFFGIALLLPLINLLSFLAFLR